jgi:spore coat polysaccharide biosynthesis protein SpsF (cytidylyltransferase family)
MAKQLDFNLGTAATFRVSVKLKKDYEKTMQLVSDFLTELNPSAEISNDIIIEKALDCLTQNPQIKKFMGKSNMEPPKAKKKESTTSAKESA